MKVRVSFSKRFIKHYDKAPAKVRSRFKEKVVVFENNPFDPALRNHALSGEWSGCRSIDITGDWRAVYEELGSNEVELVEFIEIGTHSQLYG